jgi:hypothetical protein
MKVDFGTPYAIEAQLAHVEANAGRRAYARAEFREERVKMMAWWAELLGRLRKTKALLRNGGLHERHGSE